MEGPDVINKKQNFNPIFVLKQSSEQLFLVLRRGVAVNV